MPGRPSLLTPERTERIVNAVLGGSLQEPAAEAGGIKAATLRSWLARGRAEQERLETPGTRPKASEAPYVAFLEALTRARAECELRNVAQLQRTAQGGIVIETRTITHPDGRVERWERRTPPEWRANAWWLERAAQERWMKRLHVTTRDEGAGDAELDAEIAALLGAMDQRDKEPK